ncbi:Uncharacterized protein DAT39_023172, partial [Clarias magur]
MDEDEELESAMLSRSPSKLSVQSSPASATPLTSSTARDQQASGPERVPSDTPFSSSVPLPLEGSGVD